MRFLLASVTFGIVISCIKCVYNPRDIQDSFYVNTPENMKRFCNLPQKQRESFRFCLIENGIKESTLFYRNCAQQIKFYHTLQEIDKFVCHTSSEKEYEQFLKCLIPSRIALNRDVPKRVPVVMKCLSEEENRRHHFSKYN